MAGKPQPLAPRFWSRVEKIPNGCWLWTGSPSYQGYGKISVNGEEQYVHRVSWEMANKRKVPKGKQIDHQCHNRDRSCVGGRLCIHRRCVRPSHLRAVTPKVNTGSGQNFWRNRTHCGAGHEYTEENVYYDNHKKKSGKIQRVRRCRTCERARAKAKRRKANAHQS